MGQSEQGLTFLIAGALIGIGIGTIQSSAQTIAVNKAEPHRIGLATSTFFVLYDFGVGIGPFVLGFFLSYAGFRELYTGMAGIVILCMLLYHIVHGKRAFRLKKGKMEEKQYAPDKVIVLDQIGRAHV